MAATAAAAAAGSGVPPPDYYAPTAPMPIAGGGKMGLSQQVTFGMQGPQQTGKKGSMGFVSCVLLSPSSFYNGHAIMDNDYSY